MTPVVILVGALSMYHPGDGFNHGGLACGGRLTWKQEHIALRIWRRVGCGAKARVCVYGRSQASTTRRVLSRPPMVLRVPAHARRVLREVGTCVWTTVQDSGPWGAVKGKRWEVQIKLKPGWRRRAVVDLSWALWKRLGRPRFLSKIRVEVFAK